MFRHKKRLGQNFLTDPSIADRIVGAANLSAEDQVVEIGPGKGVLTKRMAALAKRVVAVELDEQLKEVQDFSGCTNIEVVWGDFLKIDWKTLPLEPGPVKVVANIPYYITSPIIQKLLQADEIETIPLDQVHPLAESIVIMIQKEVADRILADPGSKEYGSLSIFCQYAARIERVLKVPAGAFFPPPKVDSAVIRLSPRTEPPVEVKNPQTFFRLVRAAFSQRRKTLSNCLLANGFEREAFERAANEVGIDLKRRGETLSIKEYAALANRLETR